MTDYLNLHDDLTARWRPSDDQIEMANIMIAAPGAKYVLSGHFLVGKEYGVWTGDEELIYGDDIFVVFDNDAYDAARSAAEVEAVKAAGERPGTVGYAVHYPDGDWAVFEDILPPAKILMYAEAR